MAERAASSYEGDRYPQLLRTPNHRWWRPLVGLLLAAVTVIAVGLGLGVMTVVIAWLRGDDADEAAEDSLSADTPIGLLANNLILAALIPAVMLAVLAVHRTRVGWLSSVTGRLRHGPVLRLLPVGLAVVVVFFALSFLIPGEGAGDIDVPETPTLVGLLAVIVLTTPLQAAAEEYGFRGYLTQALASWFSRPALGSVVAALVSALLFALAHGTQEPALFADRFAFGLVASWLVWRTGGLEASIVLHVVNNVVSLGWTAATGSIEESLTLSSLDWPYAVLDVTMMVVYAAAVDRLARRWNMAVRRDPAAVLPPVVPGHDGRTWRPTAPPDLLSGPPDVGYPVQRPDTQPRAGEGSPWGMG